MSCFCKYESCVNVVKAYENNNLIYTKDGYFQVVCLPRVHVNQRLINFDKEEKKVRIIIKLFNFEQFSFEDICLVNELDPLPINININRVDGIWCYQNGKLVVRFPEIKELTVYTIDYTVCFDSEGVVDSIIYIQDSLEYNYDGKVKKCISRIEV